MTSTLYIIGNGFDLYHGIPSAYKQFGTFVRDHSPDVYASIENYLATDDDFWSNFEARLADFDANALIEHASILSSPTPQTTGRTRIITITNSKWSRWSIASLRA
jgi:hypothetical protein